MAFTAIVRLSRKCQECDEDCLGDMNKMDCGCCWEKIVGEYATKAAAVGAASSKARRRGTFNGGKATGWYAVEDERGETVACGYVERREASA